MSNCPNLVEFPDFAVSVPTGVFLNPLTGAVWKLVVNEAKLMVDVPHFSFQLTPNSPTRFRPVNCLINLEFEFENPHPHNYWQMHIYAKGIKRATFQAI